MMTFTFDELKLARERGYSDDEIWNTLSTEDNEIGLAKERGYSLEEVASITSGQPLPAAEPEPERRAGGGITGGAADVGVQFMKGLGTGTRMISDVFGANNPVSKSIAGYEDYMDSLLSAESKKDSQEISRILKDAEGKGILPQIMAGLEAFTVAPAEMTATTMGMMLPNLAGGVYAKAAQLTKAGVLGLQMGIGAAQGMGSVKGQIYTAVQEELRQQGLPEDQIDKVATEAQAYNGKNLDQILIGAGLGAAASSTGAEKIMTRLITGAGKEASEGLIKSAIKGGLAEAPIEALQGGQEKIAENVALQRIGVDVPTMQGVIPAATMEATAGLLIGGGLGGVEAFVSPEKKEETDIDKKAQQTANEFLASNDPTSQAMVKELARRENAVKNLQEAYDVLEPTSQEAQRLKLELSDAQRKLSAYKEIANKAGLSLPITTAERQQVELAKAIVEEPAPTEPLPVPPAPVEQVVTPPVEVAPAPVVSEEVAQVSEVTPSPAIVERGARKRRMAARVRFKEPQTAEEISAFEKASSNKVMARNPQLAVAAVRMKNREITVDEYADLVDAIDPFTPKGPDPIPTKEKIQKYIAADKAGQVMQPIESGKEVEFRIDIPTYNRSTAAGDTVYAVTAHEPVAEDAKGVGKVISFVGAAKVNNPTFMTRSVSGKGAAIDIATGAGKFPLATVKGNYEPITELPTDINDPNVWTEVGYNPIRSSYFVDVRTKNAVVGGDEAIMVGSRVFVKNPQMEDRPKGLIGPDRRYMAAKPNPLPENERYGQVKLNRRVQSYFGGKIPDRVYVVDDAVDPEYEYKAAYYPDEGILILNNAFIRKNENIGDIIAHELGHYAFGDAKFKAAFDEFYNSLTPEEKADIDQLMGDSYNNETEESQMEERKVIAFTSFTIATPQRRSLWNAVLDAMKAFLNRVFGKNFKMSDPTRTALAILATAKRRFAAGEEIVREDIQAFIQAGQNIYEAGMEFGAWAKQMIQRFGDAVRQFLGDVWEAVSGFPAKLEEMAGYLPSKGERGAVTFGRGEEPKKPATTIKEELTVSPTPKEKITDPVTPDEQTKQLVRQAQEQENIVDSAVKEAGTTVFDVFNKLVNEGKTEDQVAKELGISNYDVRKYKLRADTAILNKMKQKKVKLLAFAPKNPVAEFAEKNLRKYFTKEGWLPKAVFQSWVKRNAALSREQKEAEFAIKDLYAGIREVFGISKMEMIVKGLVSVPPEFVQQLNDALAGKIDINTMPEPVREPLTRMRQHIDAMSRQLVDLNVLPDELSAKISENLGVYLTRSYKIFTDKNWINKIPTEKLTAARNFLYQQQLKNDPEATIEMADRELRNMLNDWASDAEGLRRRGGKLGAKDLSVMMERAKVPKVLREVMGENTNVIFNYANTIGKISRFVADQKFLNEVKAKGTGEFLFTEKDAPKGFNTQIAAEESRTMSPLNGLRTTPEIAKAFEEFGKGYDARENPGLYVLAWMNAVGKLNLTVGSVLTQIRNLLGQPAFFVFNGHYNWRVIRQEIDAIAKEKGISQEDAKKELVKLAAAQGLVNENAYAGELRTAFQDVGLETFDDIGPDEFTKQFVLTRMYLKGVKSAQELYQKTDEFGKLVGWLNETKRIQRMNKGMDKQTAQSIAAERTRDTYPTYSQSSEALRLFRRQPFFGPFATFFYETFRTSFHNLRYAFEDINGPTPEHKAEGIKRLAGAMTTLSMGAFGINLLSKLASGIGDDEEEDVRRMLPPWAKDASLAWMPKSKDGTYNFINVSYINPYNAMTDPFIAMMSGFAKGDKPEEIAAQALGSFLSPFASEQPVTATIADAMRNRTETGKQIYNPQDDITTKTSKIMLHIFGKTFTPGTITRLRERIIPAIQGETVGTRAPAPAKEIAAELTGIRFETLDMKAAFSNKAWEFSKAANESERIFRDVATRRRRVDEQEQVDAYRRSEETRYEIWNDMYRDYMAVRRAGASTAEAIRLMTDIGISKKEAIAISKGRYVPYEVSNEVLRRSKLNENKVPIKEIRAIGKEMPRVLTDITKTP